MPIWLCVHHLWVSGSGQRRIPCGIFPGFQSHSCPALFPLWCRGPRLCLGCQLSWRIPHLSALLKKTHFILTRQLTFPVTLPEQIPCRELQEVWSRPCQFFVLFHLLCPLAPNLVGPQWCPKSVFFVTAVLLLSLSSLSKHFCFNGSHKWTNLHLTPIILFGIMKWLSAFVPKSNRAPAGEGDCAAGWRCWLCPTHSWALAFGKPNLRALTFPTGTHWCFSLPLPPCQPCQTSDLLIRAKDLFFFLWLNFIYRPECKIHLLP